ncbi:ODF3B protein, partial [Pomatostomus ruficeps]|nr:ODF3B protein [Pomatostomus ruficeps]
WVGPWRPHRPRAPVAAQYRTPGPKYVLPGGVGYEQHDPSHRRAPAFSFGLRMGGPQASRSPGPQYLVPPGFTARGRHAGPAFSMGGRARERRASATPGPAQYSPEQADRVTLPSAPACSMSFRSRPDRPQQTPGPGTYQLPPVMGPRLVNKRSAPQYSISGRGPSIFEDRKRTPGPSSYGTVDTDVYMARAPRCTM